MRLWIILGIIIGIVISIIAAVVVVFLVVLPSTREVSTSSGVTTPMASTPSTGTYNPTPSPSLPASRTTLAQSPKSTANVSFSVNVPSVTISGITSVDITADLTNTGTDEAHNVLTTVEVLYQGAPVAISVDGSPAEDRTTISLGNIAAGQTVEKKLHITFGLFDGLGISQNGASFNLTITSDEKTETISYDYKP